VGWLELGTVVSRATGFARTAVWAWALGLHLVGAAFAAGNAVPALVLTLLVESVLAIVLVPQLVAAAAAGAAQERRFTDTLLSVAGLTLAGCAVLTAVVAPLVVPLYGGATWSAEDRRLCELFALCCAPQIFFSGLAGVAAQIAGVRRGFAAFVWAPVATNLVWIVGGLVLGLVGGVDRNGATAGPGAVPPGALLWVLLVVTAASAVQALVPFWALRRDGFGWRWSLAVRGLGLRRAGRTVLWSLAYLLVAHAGTVIVSAVANTAGARVDGLAVGFPVYATALAVALLPHAVFGVSRSLASFPAISEAARRGDLARVEGGLDAVLGQVLNRTVPCSLLLAVIAPAVARGVLPGSPAADTAVVADILTALALGIPFFSAFFVLVRGFYAVGDGRTPFVNQGLATVVIGVGAPLALQVLPAGRVVVGVAVVQAFAWMLGSAHVALSLRRRLGVRVRLAGALSRSFLSAVPAAVAASVARMVGVEDLLGAAVSLAVGTAAFAAVGVLTVRFGPRPRPRHRSGRGSGLRTRGLTTVTP
jgi:putative peptidoglycan lipid II flippase